MNEQIEVYLYNKILPGNKKELLVHAITKTSLRITRLSDRSQAKRKPALAISFI